MESQSSASIERIKFRTQVLTGPFNNISPINRHRSLQPIACLSYSSPELSERIEFYTKSMRRLMDGKLMQDIDWLFGIISQYELFCQRDRGGKVFVSPDINQTMEQQREITMKRIAYLKEQGLFQGWFFLNQRS